RPGAGTAGAGARSPPASRGGRGAAAGTRRPARTSRGRGRRRRRWSWTPRVGVSVGEKGPERQPLASKGRGRGGRPRRGSPPVPPAQAGEDVEDEVRLVVAEVLGEVLGGQAVPAVLALGLGPRQAGVVQQGFVEGHGSALLSRRAG